MIVVIVVICRHDQVPTIMKKVTAACLQAESVDLPRVMEQSFLLTSTCHKGDALQVQQVHNVCK